MQGLDVSYHVVSSTNVLLLPDYASHACIWVLQHGVCNQPKESILIMELVWQALFRTLGYWIFHGFLQVPGLVKC